MGTNKARVAAVQSRLVSLLLDGMEYGDRVLSHMAIEVSLWKMDMV
jgi:hypothetical protein